MESIDISYIFIAWIEAAYGYTLLMAINDVFHCSVAECFELSYRILFSEA